MTRGTLALLLAAALLGGAWGALRGGTAAPPRAGAASSAVAAAGDSAGTAAGAADGVPGRPNGAEGTPADGAPVDPATPDANPAHPGAVFAHTCGMCHALRAAGARGLTGPDLDELRPSAARVRRMVRTGSLDGVMQPGLLRGRAAQAVARFVARRAGR